MIDGLVILIEGLVVVALGSAIGSFLNVVVYRLPTGQSLLHPPSHCPRCQHRLGPTENVPVLGWLWLKGRCRHCRLPISCRYPIVEAVTGLLFAVAFFHSGWSFQTVGLWVLLSWLLTLALIDWDRMLLPSPLLQSGLVLGLGFQFALGFLQTYTLQGGLWRLMSGILAAVMGLWLFDLIRWLGSLLFRQEAMGDGDPYLVAMIGAWLGWKRMLLGTFLASAIGAIVGITALLSQRMERRQKMPFGPFLSLGAAIAAIYGQWLIDQWLTSIAVN